MRPATRRPDRSRGRRGAALVEMAVILPVFALLLLGMAEASRMCMVSQLLANAARDGCRVAVIAGKTQADVTASVKATLKASKMDPDKVTTSIAITNSRPNVQSSTRNDRITVTLSVPFKDVNWLPTPFFYSGAAPISAAAVMRSER